MTDLPDDEAVLSRFRDWLHEVRDEAETETETQIQTQTGTQAPLPDGNEAEPDVGLFRLVEEFTALRQEIKLQTKSARGLQEEAEAILPALRQAIEHFRSVAPREEQAALTAGRPLAETIVDLDESLERGRVVIEQARQSIVVDALERLQVELDRLLARQSWFRRRRLRRYHEQLHELVIGPDRELCAVLFDALLEGYGLIQSRLRRAMAAEQIRRIDCLGKPVDPETMTVIELVDNPGLPPGHVADELRRGYTWRGRVLRYAEVRAVGQQAATDPGSNDEGEP